MSEEKNNNTDDHLPPHAQLIQMSTAFIRSRVLYAAAQLGLADHLANGAKGAEELAGEIGAHEHSLHRLMRALTHYGILSMKNGHKFSLTPLGEALQNGAPGAARSTILTVAGDGFWNSFSQLPETLEDGEPGIEKAVDMSWFEYLEANPELASQFNGAMIGFHGAEPPAIVDAYDFSDYDTIVDVGGATGHMLATIFENYSGPDGILFELPRVIQEAPELLKKRGVSDRVACEAGNFFESVPEGGDAYILSHILHDWTNERCRDILRNCREAMKPESRLLVVEMVLPEDGPPHPGYELDMVMLALTGGAERTKAEYKALLNETGFQMEQLVPTESPVSVVEAKPV